MGTIKGFFYEIKRKISAFFDRGIYAKNVQEKQSLKSVKSKWKFCYLMLAVPIAHFLVFWLYLNIESILMGFREYVGGGNYVWTLKQFKTVFSSFADKESEIHLALGNTLKFFLLNIFIFCISFVFSYWLFKKVPGHRVYRVIFFMPSIISAVVLTMLFKYFIQPDGPLEKIISTLFSIDPNEIPVWLGDERYALKTVFVYSVWTGFGSNLVVVSSAMARVPESVLESVALDGISMTRELFQIVVPMIWNTLSTLIIVMVSGIFSASGEILLLTNGELKTTTISFYIFAQVKFSSSYELPSALGFFFTCIGFPLALGVRWLTGKFFADVEY